MEEGEKRGIRGRTTMIMARRWERWRFNFNMAISSMRTKRASRRARRKTGREGRRMARRE